MAAKIFATYSLKKGKPLGPQKSEPPGGFFYGLGGRQKESKLEKASDHIPDATKMVADFTFPFGMLFLLALAAVIGPVVSITSFPPVA